MPQLSNTYPVESFRGREVVVIADISEVASVVRLKDDPSSRTLTVSKNYLTGVAEATPADQKVSRMQILQYLQEYESILYRVWEGEEVSDEVTEVMEHIIGLVLGTTTSDSR